MLELRLKSITDPDFIARPHLVQLIIDNVHVSRGFSLDYYIKVQTDSGRDALLSTSFGVRNASN